MPTLKIATRKSPLALWQSEHVAAQLTRLHHDLTVELVPIVTEGDRILDRSLAAVGGKGLFIKELETALLEKRADLAVHSMKDVPAQLPDGFEIAALLERANPWDAFVSNRYSSLNDLPQQAIVGTSSLRRHAQLIHCRPDLKIIPLRGNVGTRLAKLDGGEYDAIILAAAGLERLGLAERIRQVLPAHQSLPAVGQGIVGVEVLAGSVAAAYLKSLNNQDATDCLTAERAVAFSLGASCTSALAVYATVDQQTLHVSAMAGDLHGHLVRAHIHGLRTDAFELGRDIAQQLKAQNALELMSAHER